MDAINIRPFALLIKPASADCNLCCDYCFYLKKCHLYPDSTRHRMSESVLDLIIKSYMGTEQPIYSFIWQGGEPTIMGADFFRKVTTYQEKYGRAGTIVANALQTNATLINERIAEHFWKYRFLAGCSLDGPAEIHDRYRRTNSGASSHSAALRGIETLRHYNVEFNILTLVTQSNVRQPREIRRSHLVNIPQRL
jgi:uncharacterized protein